MAEPKKKLSKTRTNRRRAQYKIAELAFGLCPNCQKPVRPHMVCPHCGYYKGVSVLSQSPTKRIVLGSDDKK